MPWDVALVGFPNTLTSLNTAGTQVEELIGLGQQPARTERAIAYVGLDGDNGGVGSFEPGSFGMRLWVDGVDRTTGAVPPGSTAEIEAWKNYQWLVGLLAGGWLLAIRVTMPDGTQRECKARAAAVAPPVWINAEACKFNVSFEIPDVYWGPASSAGANTYSLTGVASGTLTLDNEVAVGANGFINDSVLKVVGPAVNPVFVANTPGRGDIATGSGLGAPRLSLNQTIPAGVTWTCDCANFTSVLSSSTASVLADTNYTGSDKYIFRVGPPYKVSFSATGTSAATQWSITTKPKFF